MENYVMNAVNKPSRYRNIMNYIMSGPADKEVYAIKVARELNENKAYASNIIHKLTKKGKLHQVREFVNTPGRRPIKVYSRVPTKVENTAPLAEQLLSTFTDEQLLKEVKRRLRMSA
jgi:hypothetical protein